MLTRLFGVLPGGGPVSLRPKLTVHDLRAVVKVLRRKRRGAPVLGMTPISGRAELYGGLHPGRARAERAMLEWSAESAVPLIDTMTLIGAHMKSEQANPDGMHMGRGGHPLFGNAVADRLAELLAADPAPAGPVLTAATQHRPVPGQWREN